MDNTLINAQTKLSRPRIYTCNAIKLLRLCNKLDSSSTTIVNYILELTLDDYEKLIDNQDQKIRTALIWQFRQKLKEAKQ